MKLIYALYAFFIAAFSGWIMNIIEIVQAGFSSYWNGMLIARCIGVFLAPLGAVLGWF